MQFMAVYFVKSTLFQFQPEKLKSCRVEQRRINKMLAFDNENIGIVIIPILTMPFRILTPPPSMYNDDERKKTRKKTLILDSQN